MIEYAFNHKGTKTLRKPKALSESSSVVVSLCRGGLFSFRILSIPSSLSVFVPSWFILRLEIDKATP